MVSSATLQTPTIGYAEYPRLENGTVKTTGTKHTARIYFKELPWQHPPFVENEESAALLKDALATTKMLIAAVTSKTFSCEKKRSNLT